MSLRLKKHKLKKMWNFRSISQDDIDSLGVLMLESYKGTVDYEGETLEDAVAEVCATLKGKYGPLLKHSSFLIEENCILSATIVVLSETIQHPLLAYTMTLPCAAHQGMATFLIKTSINALLSHGYRELYLVVTKENTAALKLYEKVGFQPTE
jgi:hypothetical protein